MLEGDCSDKATAISCQSSTDIHRLKAWRAHILVIKVNNGIVDLFFVFCIPATLLLLNSIQTLVSLI